MSDDEDNLCPLCVEEMDLSDKFFKPCPCEYQICRFCWHHIKENLNQRCPACRRIYTDEAVQFRPVTAEEMSKLKADKKAKQRQKKEREAVDRKHLQNVRVVQKNLVYVVGLNPKVAVEEILRSQEYFGQYGKIIKLVINRKQTPGQVQGPMTHTAGNHLGVYVTYATKPEAAKAIAGIDSNVSDGRLLRATYGTTKYCQAYLRHQSCMNSGCMYLHEPGEEADSFSKEELSAGRHHQKEVSGYTSDSHRIQIVPKITTKSKTNAVPMKGAFGKEVTWETYEAADDTDEGSALPASASWANKSSASVTGSSKIPGISESNTSDAGDANSEIGDRGMETEETTSMPTQDEPEELKEIAEANVEYETEQPANIEKASDERPRHSPAASGLEITLPFAYTTAISDPFAFSFNSPISVPASPVQFRARNDFISPGVMGFPPGHEEHAQQVQYNGSFDPFSEVRTESPVLKNAPGLLPPRIDVGPRYGLGLINPPGVVLPGMLPHSEYRSSFDPFQEDVLPVSVLPPPGIGSPSTNSARLSRPPGLYDPPPPPQSPRLGNPMYHSPHSSQPEPTPNSSQIPRKSSRFGFAQDRQNNNAPTSPTTTRPTNGTFRPSVSSPGTEPMDSLHEGFRALFPTANVSFGGPESTNPNNAVWTASPTSPNSPFPNLQNENSSASWAVPFGTPNRMQAAFAAARSDSWNEGDRNPVNTTNKSPPAISSAQDFLGAFLKAAQKSSPSPTEEVPNVRVEKGARFQGALTEHQAIAAQRTAEEVDTRRKKAPFQDPAIMLIGTKSAAAPNSSVSVPRHRLPIFEHVAQGEHGRTSQARVRKSEGGGTSLKNEGKQRDGNGLESEGKNEKKADGNHRISETGGTMESRKQQQQQQQKKTKRGPEKNVDVKIKDFTSTSTSSTFTRPVQQNSTTTTIPIPVSTTTTTTTPITTTTTSTQRERNVRKNRDKKMDGEEGVVEGKKTEGAGKKNWRSNNNNNNKKEEVTKNGTSLSSSSSSSYPESVGSTTNGRHNTTTTTSSRRNGRMRKENQLPQRGGVEGKEEGEEEVEEEVDEVEEGGEEEEERKRRRKNGRQQREKEEIRNPTNVLRDGGGGKGRRTREGGEGGGGTTKMDDVATLEREVMEARREAAMVENRLNELIKKNRTYHM